MYSTCAFHAPRYISLSKHNQTSQTDPVQSKKCCSVAAKACKFCCKLQIAIFTVFHAHLGGMTFSGTNPQTTHVPDHLVQMHLQVLRVAGT